MTMPPFAFRRHAPAVEPIPLVLDSPHSGEDYPDDFDHAPPRAMSAGPRIPMSRACTARAPQFGATLLEANFPRAYIDPNRALTDIDPELLADTWPGPIATSRKTEQGIGLVWRLCAQRCADVCAKACRGGNRTRIERCYLPYHAALAAELDAAHRAFGAVWHLDCHSMPAVGDAIADDPGRVRADFVLGDRDGTTCARDSR